MKTYRYTDASNSAVHVFDEDGVSRMSLAASALPVGAEVLPFVPTELSQFERDRARYVKRAAAKDHLMAYMAADNMSRVRSGVWSVQELMSLLDDPSVAAANAYMATLSFELAAQAIQSAATLLLTAEIRTDWIGRLEDHFYSGG